MARRNWPRCVCGKKLHVKGGEKTCYICKVKERRGKEKS